MTAPSPFDGEGAATPPDPAPRRPKPGAPVRVLRLTPHFYWPQLGKSSWPVKFDAIGGMQSQIHRLTLALDRPDVHQTVLTLRIPGAPPVWKVSDHLEVRGVRVPVLPLRSRIRGMVDLNLSWALGVLVQLAKAHPRPDLVHVHCSGVVIPPLLGLALARVLGVPLVLTLHCSIVATYHPMSRLDALMQPLARWIERAAIRTASRTVVLTPRSIAQLAEAADVPAEAFAVLPDIIDADAFAARATAEGIEAVRRRWGIPKDKRVVGYVGRIAHEKGWPILLDVAERLRDENLCWLVCGDGNERHTFERELEQRGLRELFTVTGYVPNEEVPNVMGVMDLLVMTSCHEEFGSVMLEAMAVGLPIMAAGVGGIVNVLEHGRLGWLVPERSPEAFAEGIRAALADDEWRKAVTERAARAVRARYDLGEVAVETLELYREVLAEHEAATAAPAAAR